VHSYDLIYGIQGKSNGVITDSGITASKTDYHEALGAAQEAEAIVYSTIVVPIRS
jgi:hypothetical protein